MTKQEALTQMDWAFTKMTLSRPGSPAHRIATQAWNAASAAYDAASTPPGWNGGSLAKEST